MAKKQVAAKKTTKIFLWQRLNVIAEARHWNHAEYL